MSQERIVIRDLPVVNAAMRKTLLYWIAKCMANPERKGKTDMAKFFGCILPVHAGFVCRRTTAFTLEKGGCTSPPADSAGNRKAGVETASQTGAGGDSSEDVDIL